MDTRVISIYQEMSKLFLGLQLQEIVTLLQIDQKTYNSKNLEEILEKDHYYILQKTDTEFGRRFKSNLELARNNKDSIYLEYLENLLQEVNPSLANEVDLESDSLNLKNLTIKRKPKIIAKAQPIGGNKTKGTNKDVNYVDYCSKSYEITTSLQDFLPILGIKKDTKIDIPIVKLAINSYIAKKKLQDVDDRTHFRLDDNLRELFRLDETNLKMSYAKLKIELRHHYLQEVT